MALYNQGKDKKGANELAAALLFGAVKPAVTRNVFQRMSYKERKLFAYSILYAM